MEYNVFIVRNPHVTEIPVDSFPTYEEALACLAAPKLPGKLKPLATDLFFLASTDARPQPPAYSYAITGKDIKVYASDRMKDTHYARLPLVTTVCHQARVDDPYLNDMRYAWNTAWLGYNDVCMNLVKLLFALGASRKRISKLIFDCLIATSTPALIRQSQAAVDIFDGFYHGKVPIKKSLAKIEKMKFVSTISGTVEACLELNLKYRDENRYASMGLEGMRANILKHVFKDKALSRSEADDANRMECDMIRKHFPLSEVMDTLAKVA